MKSHRGTQFRIWATQRLREYIDVKRLEKERKSPKQLSEKKTRKPRGRKQ